MQTNDASSTAVADMPRLSALLRRWPTALGFGVAALMLSDFEDGRELPALQAPGTLLFGTVAFSEQAQR
jgi:hypothetical protein